MKEESERDPAQEARDRERQERLLRADEDYGSEASRDRKLVNKSKNGANWAELSHDRPVDLMQTKSA